MVHICERTIRLGFKRQSYKEEPLRSGVKQAARIGHKLAADACGAVDCRSIAEERVQIHRVVYIPRKAGDDVGRGVVRKQRLSRRVVNIENVIHSLDHIAVAHTQPLIGRLERELVPTARIALLVVVQAFKACLKLRVRLGLLAAAYGDALASAIRIAAVDNCPAIRRRPICPIKLPRKFSLRYITRTRRYKAAGLRRNRAGRGDVPGRARAGTGRVGTMKENKSPQKQRKNSEATQAVQEHPVAIMKQNIHSLYFLFE